MECPHLVNGIKFTNPLFKSKFTLTDFECSVCTSKKSPWMCVQCGIISCGRFVNGHAKAHAEDTQHNLCFDCNSYAVFCYTCDDFVINDTRTRHLHKLRKKLESSIDHENCATTSRRLTRKDDTRDGNKTRKRKGVMEKQTCKAKIPGLRNLGNTCFMNAVLQSLSNIQQFSYYFKQLPTLERPLKNGIRNGSRSIQTNPKRVNGGDVLLAEELRKTLVSLLEGSSKSAISPESLFAVIWKVVPRYRGYQQQDAHEFLRYMLDRLHTELIGILPYPNKSGAPRSIFLGPAGKSTIVTAIFGGLLQNEVTCLACGTESKKHDPFLDLSLDIPQSYVTDESTNPSEPTAIQERYHLFDCLSSFMELEELAETERYFCPSCKQKQKSTKRFWIRRLPNVLCLHLKRFRWNNYYRTKLDNHIDFPIKSLDMSKYVLSNKHETRGSTCGSTLYDLAAVIVHHGSGAGSGHYTSYATHEGCWHHFNDSSVTICDEKTIAQSKAYILFYIRRELNLTPFSL